MVNTMKKLIAFMFVIMMLMTGFIGFNATSNEIAKSPGDLNQNRTLEYGSWVQVGNLNEARHGHVSVLLQNGNVLVTGGINDVGKIIPSTEIFDGSTWTKVTNMPVALYGHRAVVLDNGSVMVTGGYNITGDAIDRVFIYDSVLDKWINGTETGGFALANHTMLLATTTSVIVSGGDGNKLSSNVINFGGKVYYTNNNTWFDTFGSMPTGLNAAIATLGNGTPIMCGGGTGFYPSVPPMEVYDKTMIYDDATNKWVTVTNLNQNRSHHTLSILDSGNALAVGGYTTGSITVLNHTEIYDYTTKIWTPAATLHGERYVHVAAELQNGEVLVAGGLNNTFSPIKTAEIYNETDNKWYNAPAMPTTKADAKATVLNNGSVLVSGGYSSGFSATTTTYLYVPQEKQIKIDLEVDFPYDYDDFTESYAIAEEFTVEIIVRAYNNETGDPLQGVQINFEAENGSFDKVNVLTNANGEASANYTSQAINGIDIGYDELIFNATMLNSPGNIAYFWVDVLPDGSGNTMDGLPPWTHLKYFTEFYGTDYANDSTGHFSMDIGDQTTITLFGAQINVYEFTIQMYEFAHVIMTNYESKTVNWANGTVYFSEALGGIVAMEVDMETSMWEDDDGSILYWNMTMNSSEKYKPVNYEHNWSVLTSIGSSDEFYNLALEEQITYIEMDSMYMWDNVTQWVYYEEYVEVTGYKDIELFLNVYNTTAYVYDPIDPWEIYYYSPDLEIDLITEFLEDGVVDQARILREYNDMVDTGEKLKELNVSAPVDAEIVSYDDVELTYVVYNTTDPIVNANVTLELIGNGTLDLSEGNTNDTGAFTVTYTAPLVNDTKNVTINATIKAVGYKPYNDVVKVSISPDTEVPIITHVQPTNVVEGMDVSLLALVTDNGPIQEVSVMWRKVGETNFTKNNMELEIGFIYNFTIPDIYVTTNGLEYYFEAVDKSNNSVRLPSGISDTFTLDVSAALRIIGPIVKTLTSDAEVTLYAAIKGPGEITIEDTIAPDTDDDHSIGVYADILYTDIAANLSWVSIEFDYSAVVLPEMLNEDNLSIYYWDAGGNQWVEADNVELNTTANTISTNTTQLRIFSLRSKTPIPSPGPTTVQVTLGPILDENGAPVEGATVSIINDSQVMAGTTGANGIAIIDIPVDWIGHEVTVEIMKSGYKDLTFSGTIGADYRITPTAGGNLPTLQPEKEEEPDEKETDLTPWLIAIAIVIIIIIIIVALFMLRKRPVEEEYLEEEGRYEGTKEEYECPECGAIVMGGVTTCPECGVEFEEEEFACPECGASMGPGDTTCPECGIELEVEEEEEFEADYEDEDVEVDFEEDRTGLGVEEFEEESIEEGELPGEFEEFPDEDEMMEEDMYEETDELPDDEETYDEDSE